MLGELNKFERSFGLYILSVTSESEEYLFNAKRNVELLAHSKENIGYIFRETEELLAKEGVEVEIFVPGCK